MREAPAGFRRTQGMRRAASDTRASPPKGDVFLFCIATFDTTHMALRFEKLCRAAGYDTRIVPVPRELSSSCGLACRYPCDRRGDVERLAAEHSIDVAGYHELT